MEAFSQFPFVDLLAAAAAFILLLQQRQPGDRKLSQLTVLVFAGLVLLQLALMVMQYQSWRADPLMKLTLPPHTDIAYFLRYGYFAFLRPVVWRFLGAAIIFVTMSLPHNLFRRSLFLSAELRFVPGLALLPAFPLNLLLLPLGLLAGVGSRLGQSSRWSEKQPLKVFWLPLTVVLAFVALALGQTSWFYRFQP